MLEHWRHDECNLPSLLVPVQYKCFRKTGELAINVFIQFADAETAVPFARTLMGKISDIRTHDAGPHEKPKLPT